MLAFFGRNYISVTFLHLQTSKSSYSAVPCDVPLIACFLVITKTLYPGKTHELLLREVNGFWVEATSCLFLFFAGDQSLRICCFCFTVNYWKIQNKMNIGQNETRVRLTQFYFFHISDLLSVERKVVNLPRTVVPKLLEPELTF